MALAQSYYSVYKKYFDTESDRYIEDNFIFDNFQLPIRFRRQESIDKFFEFYRDQNVATVRLSFHDSYTQRELGEDYEFCTERMLFEVTNGKLNIDWLNWSNETNKYTGKGEVCFGKLVKTGLPNGNITEVYSDKICQKLNVPFEYFEWED